MLNCLESINREEYLEYTMLDTFQLKKLADIFASSEDKTRFETIILNKLSEKELKKLQARFCWGCIISRGTPLYPLMKRYCTIPDNTSYFKSLLGQEKLFSFIK